MPEPVDRRRWRLLPFEEVLWRGVRTPGVPPSRAWRYGAALLLVFAAIAALFAALLAVAGLPGAADTAGLAALLGAIAIGAFLAPRHLSERLEYLVTDRRVLWSRGRLQRQMDRHEITFGRLRWHPTIPHVADIELVVAVPFGPLSRKQRLTLEAVSDPDSAFAIIRGVPPHENANDRELPLVERLDPDESVLWGGHPEGAFLGWRELSTAGLGLLIVILGCVYGANASGVLAELEELGLAVRSWTWLLFFLPVLLSFSVMISVGSWLLWWGLVRARALGRDTAYLLTDRRLMIRRGRVELSVDRHRIVDVASLPASGQLSHLFLVLDSPRARALAVNGALAPLLPSRELVLPILYAVRDGESLRRRILGTLEADAL